MKAFNAKWQGEYHIIVSKTETHFMNSEATLTMFNELYGPAFAARRKQRGYKWKPRVFSWPTRSRATSLTVTAQIFEGNSFPRNTT